MRIAQLVADGYTGLAFAILIYPFRVILGYTVSYLVFCCFVAYGCGVSEF